MSGLIARAATREDDAAVRALLRERPMDGLVRVALTREPDASVAADVEGERHVTFVGYDAQTQDLLGTGTRSVRRVWLGGEQVLVGYMSQLRIAQGLSGIRRLRDAYEFLRRTHQPDEAAFDISTIVSDNLPARRLLERGLPGMPDYRRLCELETLVLPTARVRSRESGRPAREEDRERLLAFLDRAHRRHAFAPVWSAAGIGGRLRDLAVTDFHLVEEEGQIVAAGAVWDQRAFKQTLVAGYAPWLWVARPLVNTGLAIAGRPTLPRPGATLPLGFLCGFAVETEGLGDPVRSADALVGGLRRSACARGLRQLALTLDVAHPLRAHLLSRFCARPYRSVLYSISWPGNEPPSRLLGGALAAPEGALL